MEGVSQDPAAPRHPQETETETAPRVSNQTLSSLLLVFILLFCYSPKDKGCSFYKTSFVSVQKYYLPDLWKYSRFYEDDDKELELAATSRDPAAPAPEGTAMAPALGPALDVPAGLPRNLEAAIQR